MALDRNSSESATDEGNAVRFGAPFASPTGDQQTTNDDRLSPVNDRQMEAQVKPDWVFERCDLSSTRPPTFDVVQGGAHFVPDRCQLSVPHPSAIFSPVTELIFATFAALWRLVKSN